MQGSVVRVGLGPAGLPSIRNAGDRAGFVDFVQRAERAGYSSICVGDHLDDRGAPLLLLTAAAMHTEHIGLATHVLCNEFRNAGVLAHEARTLQAIAAGRLELGLGTGWLDRDFAFAGVEMAPFRERLERLEAAVDKVRSTTGPDGNVPPRITLGGGGPQMLRFAARLADIVTINIPLRSGAGLASNTVASGTASAFAERVALVRDTAASAGRSVELHTYVHHVHLGPSWRVDAAAAAAKLGISVDAYVASPHVLAGEVDQVAGVVVDRRDELGLGYFSIPGAHLDVFTPVLDAVG